MTEIKIKKRQMSLGSGKEKQTWYLPLGFFLERTEQAFMSVVRDRVMSN